MNKLSNDHFQFEDEFRHSDVPVDLSEIKNIVRRTRDQERQRSVWLVDKELKNAQHALDRAVESGEEKDVVFGCMCWVQACETMLKKVKTQLGRHEG